MEDLEIKLAMMSMVTRDKIKDLMLTNGDYELMCFIASGENTSSKISELAMQSVQSVSGRLAKLRRKGYITRKQVMQVSGGYEFEYSNLFKIVE